MKLILTATFALTLAACGTWQDTGRRTIEVSAVAVDGVDTALARAVVRACTPEVEGLSPGPARDAAVDACVRAHHFKEPADAIHGADASLRSGQAIIDAGVESAWLARLPCLAKSIVEAFTAVEAVGVTLPTGIASTRAIIESYASQCHAGGT